MNLLDSDSEDEHQLTINEHYAKAFEYRKEREELEKRMFISELLSNMVPTNYSCLSAYFISSGFALQSNSNMALMRKRKIRTKLILRMTNPRMRTARN